MNRTTLAERDFRMFEARKSGLPVAKIAQSFGVSTAVVHKAIERQLAKLNREALLGSGEMVRLELERLDALQQAIWPLTQHRQVKLDDGTIMKLEPDLKAVAEVRAIMTQRAKLLGMDAINLNVTTGTTDTTPARATLAGTERPLETTTHSPENEARQLLQIMAMSGVLPEDTVTALLNTPTGLPTPTPPTSTADTPGAPPDDVIDAELIED